MPLTKNVPVSPDESTLDDAEIEDWLRDEVAPVFDAMKADPSQALKAEDVFAKLARHIERTERPRR